MVTNWMTQQIDSLPRDTDSELHRIEREMLKGHRPSALYQRGREERTRQSVIGQITTNRAITRCGRCDRPVWLDTTGRRQTWKHGHQVGFVEVED